MNSSHALALVLPLIEATQDMKRRKVSKTRCDELLLSINALPLGAFEGQGADLERLWMQALSSFRYALLLWLYGDVQAAREESEKANRKIEEIRSQALATWAPPVEAPRELVAH
ncbi:MAG TPA: hypothetical protein VNM67_12980 [Thermoanaerobaculia bacterium]|jgi:hypothetical protein|nr:hypothetical protein [Thermoanaerobaculia bacterium]